MYPSIPGHHHQQQQTFNDTIANIQHSNENNCLSMRFQNGNCNTTLSKGKRLVFHRTREIDEDVEMRTVGDTNDSTIDTATARKYTVIQPIDCENVMRRRRWCVGGTKMMIHGVMAVLIYVVAVIMVNLEFFKILNNSDIVRLVTVKHQELYPPQKGGTIINEANVVDTINHHSKEHPTSIRPFPKWGASIAEEQESGISFPPLLSFIQTSSPYKGLSPYYRSTLDHSKESKTMLHLLPETLYIIQPSYHRINTTNTKIYPPILYNSNLHRINNPGAVASGNEALKRKHKLNQTERVMLHALQILHRDLTANIDSWQLSDNACQYTRWPSLCQNLYPSLKPIASGIASTRNKTTLSGGFPFLAWFGDYTGCNHHNWMQLVDTDEPIARNLLPSRDTVNVSIPLFTVAAQSKACNYTFPFPNFYQISDTSTQWDIQMEQNRANYSWSQKIPKIVWRGSLTGRIDNNETKCPRWNMVETIYHIEKQRRERHKEIAKATTITTRNPDVVAPSVPLSPQSDYQELFDAKLTSILHAEKQYQSQLEHEIGDQPIGGSELPFQDFQKYRGIIDIDGHSWSGRFGSLLCMNSVILKVDPNYVEYFYARRRNGKSNDLQAWKHYIPIRADFSNLEEIAEYVLDPANDYALQEMVHQANEWCRQNMIVSRVMLDMLDVWDRYVELLNINNSHWLEQYWTDDIQSTILENDNLNMVVLNISDYPSIVEGQ